MPKFWTYKIDMFTSRLALELANKVYSHTTLNKTVVDVHYAGKKFRFFVLDKINTSQKLTGGLEALALSFENNLVFVIRGADVGIGRNVFKMISAEEKFIPSGSGPNVFKSSFQDWLWNGLLGSLGIVRLTQYDDMKIFFKKNVKQFSNHHIFIVGHSLGGEIAQRLSLDFHADTITFGAISPWWSLSHIERKKFLNNGIKDDKINNFYSTKDPFHYFPSRKLGNQNSIVLKDYTSNSTLMAMFVERIYWAHGLNFYEFNKYGEIIIMQDASKYEKFFNYLNKKSIHTFWIDLFIVLSGVLPTIVMWLTVQLGIEKIFPNYALSNISISLLVGMSLLGLMSTIIYMLPTFIVHSRWKYLIWALNLTLSWTGIGWFILLIIAFILNNSYTSKNIATQNKF